MGIADGFMGWAKAQFIDILEWQEAGDDVLAWRFPMRDNEIQNGAQLTVRPSQTALFVNEGKTADVFREGLYKLTTNTLPVLTSIRNWDKLFASPFKSDVYFFSLRERVGRGWGTQQPVTIRDTDFGAVQVRGNGQYSFRIADAKVFFDKLSGSREVYRVADIESQLRNAIVSILAPTLGGAEVSFIDMAARQGEMQQRVRDAVAAEFTRLGLELTSFQIVSLTLPESIQKVLDERIRLNVLEPKIDTYTRVKAADAMTLAAANEGGGGMAAMGAQMAVGVGVGQAMQQALMPAPAGGAVPAAPAAAAAVPFNAVAHLKSLKELLDGGLISAEDYEREKTQALERMRS